MRILYVILALVCVLNSSLAFSQKLSVCYQANCLEEINFTVSEGTHRKINTFFLLITSAIEEREAIRHAVRSLYLEAAKHSPIASDRGGNFKDYSVKGRMDCVDHSRNSTKFITYIQQQGWLNYHKVGEIVWRNPLLINLHYASQIIEINTLRSWVVDTWFLDFGELATVVPYDKWKDGYSPQS
tara:strand:+ start:75 stop:626 length:552 start_codon:yes stop_codon:yes gene_type:complete